MNWFLVPGVVMTLVGMASPIFFGSLNKNDQLDWARYHDCIRSIELRSWALYWSPLLANLLLAVFWRNRQPFMGFVMCVVISTLISWGQLVDHMAWKEIHFPGHDVKLLAGYIASGVAWLLLFMYWLFVIVTRWLNQPAVVAVGSK